MDIDSLCKALEHIDGETFAKDFLERMEKAKIIQDEQCAQGDHGSHLTCLNLSGGWIHWKCTHCGKLISKPDLPMTI